MRILILATHFNPGGISRYVLSLAKGLVGRGHVVWVACSGGEWVSELEGIGAKYKFIPINTKSICSPKIILAFFSLAAFVKKEGIEIIHSNTRVTQFLGFLILKVSKVPYLSTFHGFYRSTFFRRLFKLAGLRAIAVSQAVKNHLVKDLGFDEGKIGVVYNGINLDEFNKHVKNKQDYGFKKSDLLIGVLGRISAEKGHFLAVDAITKISSEYKNAYLLFSGQGKQEQKVKIYIKKKSLEKKVKFIDTSAACFLDILDLLIVPSEKEGFGYSIVEAFAFGKPVIGTDLDGIPELIENRGVVYKHSNKEDLLNAIIKLSTNYKLYQTLSKNCLKYYNSFPEWEDIKRIIKNLIEEIN